jgi:putative two-component system response regulator
MFSLSDRPVRVLCVDDEPIILKLMARLLSSPTMEVITCGDPHVALEAFDRSHFDLVITDIRMPTMDGHALVQRIRGRDPQVPVLVVTGQGTVENALEMLRHGASGMLLKPFTSEELRRNVDEVLARAIAMRESLQYRFVAPILDALAFALSTAIEKRNLETAEHCRGIGDYGLRMARALGLDEPMQTTIRIGGFLHDVGKIGVKDSILLKPGPLTDDEMAEMRLHAANGAEILGIHQSLDGIAMIVRHHHERWDGSGYPDHLAGREIPMGARIIAVADVFSAMTSDRPYRKALPLDHAWAELRRHAGSQFDPEMVEVFDVIAGGEEFPRETDAAGTAAK